MVHGALSLALSSVRTTETHVERVLSLQFRDQSLKRSLVHLHFSTWPELCVCCLRLGGVGWGSYGNHLLELGGRRDSVHGSCSKPLLPSPQQRLAR